MTNLFSSSPGAAASSSPCHAGIHLSGSNAHKTAVVVLTGHSLLDSVRIAKVYEKIGSFGNLFSDERLVDILSHVPNLQNVFVDCPLSLPPCVACARPSCPGAIKCDDVTVAYMLSLSSKVKAKRAQRLRPLNPQSQRLWDAYEITVAKGPRPEPTYSSNMAPVVARARVLQRRLNSPDRAIHLQETSASMVLQVISSLIGTDRSLIEGYKDFEFGRDVREGVLEGLLDMGWIGKGTSKENIAAITGSVEVFQAFLCAWLASLYGAQLTVPRPKEFLPSEGWVHRPLLWEKVP